MRCQLHSDLQRADIEGAEHEHAEKRLADFLVMAGAVVVAENGDAAGDDALCWAEHDG